MQQIMSEKPQGEEASVHDVIDVIEVVPSRPPRDIWLDPSEPFVVARARSQTSSTPPPRIPPTTPRVRSVPSAAIPSAEPPARPREKSFGVRLAVLRTFPQGRSAYLLPGILAAIGIVLILVGVFGPTLSHSNAKTRASALPVGALQLSLPVSMMLCPEIGAWSTDGEQVAILGTDRACNVAPGTHSTLALYDATTGKTLKTYALAPMILPSAVPAQVRGDTALATDLNITFTRLLWSPNGHTLAMGFETNSTTPDKSGKLTTTQYGAGLLLLDTSSGKSEIIPALTAQGPTVPTGQPLQLIRWDIAHRTARFIWLPQAAGYTWQGDTLAPITALSSTTKGTGAAVLAAGADMSVWTGSAVGLDAPCATTSTKAGTKAGTAKNVAAYYHYQTSLAAWSPDGNVLIYGQWGQARIAATPTTQVARDVSSQRGCSSHDTAALTQMPVLDAGMARALDALGSQPTHPTAAVAWSPDGRYLACLPNTPPSTAKVALTIYNTVKGRVAATIPSAALYRVASGKSKEATAAQDMHPQLLWSQDGRSLLVLDGAHRLGMLLGPRALNA